MRLPPSMKNAAGHGFRPRTRLCTACAGIAQSISPISLRIIGACVAAASSCGSGTIVSSRSIVSTSSSAPISLRRSNSSPEVSFSPISVSAFRSMSPVSSPSPICWIVTPVVFSPFSTAHWIGAAPRYFGSSEPWTLMQPLGGIARTAGGSSLPYAATAISSGFSARSVSAASSVRSVAGWYTGMSRSSASALTGGGSSLCPRPFGLSGCV